jgi:hypothetical protein
LRRFEGVRRIAPGAFSRNPDPEFTKGKDLDAFDLCMALGGWLPAACRGVYSSTGWFLPDLE